MAKEASTGATLERWLGIGANIVAPATVISTLLFYFGYVSSRAQYAYFGLDVDTIGLSTQDFVMRSPQPLLVPLLVLSMLTAGAVVAHTAIRRRMTTVQDARAVTRRWLLGGLTVLAAGLVLLFAYPVLRGWPLYPLVTPLVLAVGSAATAYSLTWHGSSGPAARAALWIAMAASVFWTTATLAQWTGLGLAQAQARSLDDLPSVVLDTQERLFLTSPDIDESALEVHEEQQTFRYRYRGLHLLIQGDDGMFLVPGTWSASNSTLLVQPDGGVRVQFRFVNQPP